MPRPQLPVCFGFTVVMKIGGLTTTVETDFENCDPWDLIDSIYSTTPIELVLKMIWMQY